MSRRGLLIAVEGPDGVGRTTQCRLLRARLEESGHRVTRVRLKGSPLSRRSLQELQRRGDVSERALFLLYAADIADQLHYVIEPALATGQIVLCDRYLLTPIVRAEARGLGVPWAAQALSFAPPADRTLVLEADARVRLARMLSRRRFLQPRELGQGSTYRRDATDQALRYQRLLDRLFANEANIGRIVRVDAGQPVEAVQQELLRAIADLLA